MTAVSRRPCRRQWWAGESAALNRHHLLPKAAARRKITISDAVTGRVSHTDRSEQHRTQSLAVGPISARSDLPVVEWGGGRGGGGGGGGGGCPGNGRLAPVGAYKVSVTVGGAEIGSHVFRVLEDIWLNER